MIFKGCRKKRIAKRIFTAWLAAGLFLVSLPGSSRSVCAKTTEEKLREAQEQKQQTEGKLDETNTKIDSLENTKTSLQGVLTGLNDNLVKVSNELSNIEDQLSDKEAQIEETENAIDELEEDIDTLRRELKEAKAEAADQYEVMKLRIRRIYERGDDDYGQILIGAKSIGEMLNHARYVEKANEYDRNLLSNLKAKRDEIAEKKKKLEEDKEEVEKMRLRQEQERGDIKNLQTDAAAQQNLVKGMVNDTVTQIHGYSGQIAQAEADARAYEAQIAQENENIKALEAELARERELLEKSRRMKKKDLSQINVAEGERELLACLIYCEAGNEPYTGQVAVGAVVMNRCMSGAFPDTITGVIYQSGQFSPVASGRLSARLAQGANDSCYRAADEAMSGSKPIGDCLFFRTVIPEISGQIIGNHVFYNP